MSEIRQLKEYLEKERTELLEQIKEIEENFEGLDNKDNAEHVRQLNYKVIELNLQKQELEEKIKCIEKQLENIHKEIVNKSENNVKKILNAISRQRFFFIANNAAVFMDRKTFLCWANLNLFPYRKNNGLEYDSEEAKNIIQEYDFGKVKGFRLPTKTEILEFARNTENPYYVQDSRRIFGCRDWLVHNGYYINLSDDGLLTGRGSCFPCSDYYAEQEVERTPQAFLNLLIKNNLLPIINDSEASQIYEELFIKKPALLEKLKSLEAEIAELDTVKLLSAEFDYTVLLKKYDLAAIDHSVIQYYRAVQQWIGELMELLDSYEKEKEDIIRDCNLIGLSLSKKYEDAPSLSQEENRLMKERQRFFRNRFALGMNTVKAKLLSVRRQADDLEDRIEEIDESEDSIRQFALLEKEERAGFAFIAENTAKIIKNALLKIEFFESHHDYVMKAVDIWENWTEEYRIFKTTYREDLKNLCIGENVEEETWSKWYEDWRKLRLAIEEKVQPMIEYGLNSEMAISDEDSTEGTEREKSVPERIIHVLHEYKEDVDQFYLIERLGIYQKYVFQSGGELQEKCESESELYKCTSKFQSALQDILFSCSRAEDRIFILNWANSLLDIQIDEILAFVADNDLQKVSKEILEGFSSLKRKNYDIYLTDAKAYGEEKARREKEYNSLMFRMRKDLMR